MRAGRNTMRVGVMVMASAACVFLLYRILFYGWMSATPERDARDWSSLIVRDVLMTLGVLAAWLLLDRALRRVEPAR